MLQFIKHNYGFLISAFVFCVALYTAGKAIFDHLIEKRRQSREIRKIVEDLNIGAAMKQVAVEGYIFMALFKIEHILKEGQRVGIVLTRAEAYEIVTIITKDYHPEVGINNSVIREACRRYAITKGFSRKG